MRGWAPLRLLAVPDLDALERALGERPREEVETLIGAIETRATSEVERAALSAARLAVVLRSGDSGDAIEEIAKTTREKLEQAQQLREATFVEVERIALIGARRERLAEAGELAERLPATSEDPELAAAVLRLRGSLARARADLRGSLLTLEQARVFAESSGSIRELIRTYNTLGTSYAALGIGELARQWLEKARELALLVGQRQSAAIASGQLAVLAMDEHQPARAARHLEAQRAACQALDDTAGFARALSLLVEAYAAAHDPERSAACAEQSRALYTSAPSAWTHLQAVLATMYEAEQSLLAHDEGRASVLLASCETERTSAHPGHRVVRAREAFVVLAKAALHPGPESLAEIDRALVHLRRSPRPAWVERALTRASRLAIDAGEREVGVMLALRAAMVREARGAAGAGALGLLANVSAEVVVPRAMALARDLVQRARLALAPLSVFDAHVIEIETDGTPGALDAAIASFTRPDFPGEPPDDLAVAIEGLSRATVATTFDEVAASAHERLRQIAGVRRAERSQRKIKVIVDLRSASGFTRLVIPSPDRGSRSNPRSLTSLVRSCGLAHSRW
ncbi:MAG: hypothetical protein U0165_10235 [Polyangiaceae bacterium]